MHAHGEEGHDRQQHHRLHVAGGAEVRYRHDNQRAYVIESKGVRRLVNIEIGAKASSPASPPVQFIIR